MSRRYDRRTTIFSPEGRLYQVEYAMEAISHAGTALGIQAKDGIILAAEKKITSKLLDNEQESEKFYQVDNHIACAVAGITADANILINNSRLYCQQYLYTYSEPVPVEHLIKTLCNSKQAYTQFGGMRPFGVAFLYAGWDEFYGFQLYHSDPSGNYSGWQATAIGNNHQSAQSILKQDWNEEMDVKGALELAAKVMSKTMDTSMLSSEKVEFAKISRENGKVVYHVLTEEEVGKVLKDADVVSPQTEEE
eukprot:gb/GECH01010909.1/.p1 GENE.gb/GECH01010909.1/~~gb/GECH01010909.1/.p1  ORF type:complete len:250 (+),score=64.47 gb/GECH01010909.1/:1-750(+)